MSCPQRFFEEPDIFVCPFADLPSCAYKDRFIESFSSLMRHVDLFHKGENIAPYTDNMNGDGTRKISRPRVCDETFRYTPTSKPTREDETVQSSNADHLFMTLGALCGMQRNETDC